MRVIRIEGFRKELHLAGAGIRMASANTTTITDVYLVLTTDDGQLGYGEVRGNMHYFTGDTADRTLDVLQSLLVPRILGREVQDLPAILSEVHRATVGNHAAKAVLEIALHDLAAKRLGIPLYELLGGRASAELPSNQTIPFGTPAEAEEHALRYVAEGYGQLKLRVGMRPFQADLDRLRAVAAVAAGRASLAVDANQAWTPKEAIRNIRALNVVGLEYVEQPTPARDLHALRQVTAATEVPIMADESLQSPRDALELIRLQAVDLLHIKLVKVGGLIPARQVMAIAEAAGVGYMMGQMTEGRAATTAAAHCGAASRATYFELYGSEEVLNDPAKGVRLVRGKAILPEGPGLGVELDLGSLDRIFTLEVR